MFTLRVTNIVDYSSIGRGTTVLRGRGLFESDRPEQPDQLKGNVFGVGCSVDCLLAIALV